MRKSYVSKHQEFCIYGGKRIGMIRFANGRHSTSNESAQETIENSTWFKRGEIVIEKPEEVKRIVERESRKQEEKEEENAEEENAEEENAEEENAEEENAEEEFVCDVCGKAFTSQNALNGHRTVHYRTGELVAKGDK